MITEDQKKDIFAEACFVEIRGGNVVKEVIQSIETAGDECTFHNVSTKEAETFLIKHKFDIENLASRAVDAIYAMCKEVQL